MSYTPERTWHTAPNMEYMATTNGDLSRWILWNIKASLMGQIGGLTLGLWTMYTSSDSTVGGTGVTGDGVDRWGSVYDASKIVLANAGSAHSWAVLRSPLITAGAVTNTYFYLLISANDGGSFQVATVKMAKTAFASGTSTADPTSANSWTPGGSNAVSTHGSTAGGVNANLNHVVQSHLFLSTSGDFVHIVGLVGLNTIQYPLHGIIAVVPVSPPVSDLFPWFTYRTYNAFGCFTNSSNGFYANGNTSLANDAPMPDGSAGECAILNNSTAPIYFKQPDMLTGLFPMMPCPLIAFTAGVWEMRGHLPDIRTLSGAASNGVPEYGTTLYDSSGVLRFVSVGQLWIPTDQSIAPSN